MVINLIDIFSPDTYIELMNAEIKKDKNYIDGMLIQNISSGIALTLENKDITRQHPMILLKAHTEIVHQIQKFLVQTEKYGFNAFRLKLTNERRYEE